MSDIVYSTDPDWTQKCEKCGNSVEECVCNKPKSKVLKNQTAHISRETKGRRGKTVTVISNLSGDMQSLLKEMQKKCASGGALKKHTIEIQGDHIGKIKTLLEEKGCKVKKVGG